MVCIGPIFPCEEQLVKADLHCSRHSFCPSLPDPREGLSTSVVNFKLQRPTQDFICSLSMLFKYLSQLIMRAIDNGHQTCAPFIQSTVTHLHVQAPLLSGTDSQTNSGLFCHISLLLLLFLMKSAQLNTTNSIHSSGKILVHLFF